MPSVRRNSLLAEISSAATPNCHIAWLLARELEHDRPRPWALWVIGGYCFFDILARIAIPVTIILCLWEAVRLGLI